MIPAQHSITTNSAKLSITTNSAKLIAPALHLLSTCLSTYSPMQHLHTATPYTQHNSTPIVKCDHHLKFVVFVLSNWHDILPIEYFCFHCLLIVFSGEHNISIILDDVLCHRYSPSLYFANSFLHKIKLNL